MRYLSIHLKYQIIKYNIVNNQDPYFISSQSIPPNNRKNESVKTFLRLISTV